MNEVYGISPHLGISARELGLLLGSFGFRHGRFLARFPGSWVRELLDALHGVGDAERKAFTTILKSHAATFLSLGEPYDASQTWLDNALNLLNRGAVDGLIAQGSPSRDHIYSVDDFACSRVPDSAGLRTLASAENLVRCLRPVVLSSSEVILIDPYMCIASRRYQRFLCGLAADADSRGKTYRIFSSSRHFTVKESLTSQSARCFCRVDSPGCDFFFYVRGGQSDMHGRYAFNVHGGLKYDKGFGVEDQVEVDIEAMSETARGRYFEMYTKLVRETLPVWHVPASGDT